MKKINAIILAALVTVLSASSVYAIAGLGFHWGFDLSLSMDDVKGEKVALPTEALLGSIQILDYISPDIYNEIANAELFRISRTNFRRSVINFGGKAYIDILPVDIEVSCNFGVWEYDGALEFIDARKTAESILGGGGLVYDTLNLGLGDQGMSKYFGMSGTPYAKLHFDATVKKQVLNLWLIKFAAGAGASMHMATPLLSSAFIEDALGTVKDNIDEEFLKTLASSTGGNEHGKLILEKMKKEALDRVIFGGHVVLGMRAKLPVMPVGLYIDSKFMFPFTSFDKDVDKSNGIKGFGFLINTGISLSI